MRGLAISTITVTLWLTAACKMPRVASLSYHTPCPFTMLQSMAIPVVRYHYHLDIRRPPCSDRSFPPVTQQNGSSNAPSLIPMVATLGQNTGFRKAYQHMERCGLRSLMQRARLLSTSWRATMCATMKEDCGKRWCAEENRIPRTPRQQVLTVEVARLSHDHTQLSTHRSVPNHHLPKQREWHRKPIGGFLSGMSFIPTSMPYRQPDVDYGAGFSLAFPLFSGMPAIASCGKDRQPRLQHKGPTVFSC